MQGNLLFADAGNNRIRKISLNTAPTVATTIPSQTATVGQVFSYTLPANAFTDAESPNSLTYTASIVPPNGLVYDAVSRVISGTPTATGVSNVTVVATDPGNLTASQTFTITVNCPVITASISGNLTVCSGGSTTLTASGGSTFLWSTGQTTAMISATAGTYSVTVSSGSCSASTSATVAGTCLPVASLSNNGPLTCAQTSVTLTAGGGSSYTFTSADATLLAGSGNTRIVSSPGTYSVRVANASGCVSTTSTSVLSNTAIVTVTNPATYSALINASFSQSFIASGGSSPYSYSVVSSNLPATLSLSVAGVLSGTPTVAGSYSLLVQAQDANGCVGTPTNAYSLTVVDPTPTLTGFSASSASVCVGNPVTFTATVGNVTGSYNYTLTNGTSTITGTTSTTAFSQTLVASSSGNQSFTLVASVNGFQAITATGVVVNTLPVAALGNNGPLTCAQTSVTLTAGGGSSYAFSLGAMQLNNTNIATVASPGSYSVTITSAQGCSATAITTVTSNTTAPSLSIKPSALTGCAGQSIQLTASGGDTYRWSTNQTTPTISVSVTGSQLYSVTAISTSNGCSATASQSITIQPLPAPPSLVTSPNQPFPAGVSTLTASQNTGNVILVAGCSAGTLSWDGGSSTSLTVSTASLGEQRFQGICQQNGCSSPASVASVTVVATTLSVLHRDADYGSTTNNILKPYLELANAGNQAIPYGELRVRYWFTSEGNALPTNLAVYYAPLGAVSMQYVALSQPRQGAYGYVEYSFPGGGSLGSGGNSGPIENGIQKTDRSNFDESDDYSYQANYANYLANAHVTAYRNGVIVWGQEPTAVATQTALQVYSQAKDGTTTSQIQTRLELRNTGNVAVAVSSLKLRYYFTSDNGQLANVYVDYADLGASNVQARVVQFPPVSSADSYVELSFPGNTQTVKGLSSLGAIDFRIVRSDYGLLDQSNDYSYAANYGNVSLNNHVTAYLNTNLVFGTPPSGAPARQVALESGRGLSARVLGNPVTGAQAEVEIQGAQEQAVELTLVDLQGRRLWAQRVVLLTALERVMVPLGSSRGNLVLQVGTASERVQLKLVRP